VPGKVIGIIAPFERGIDVPIAIAVLVD